MGFYSTCACYEDIAAHIRISEGSIFMTLKMSENDESIQVTLNPMQSLTLGKILTNAAGSIAVGDMKCDYWGDMTVDVELDNNSKEDVENERSVEACVTGSSSDNSSHHAELGQGRGQGQGSEMTKVPAA